MRTTLKDFLNKMQGEYNFSVANGYTPITRKYKDSNNVEFESTSLVFTTTNTHPVFDEETGENVEKPIFVAISLSKNTNDKRMAEKKEFDSTFLLNNLSATVEVDPEYPTSAKIISNNKVVDKGAKALANALAM